MNDPRTPIFEGIRDARADKTFDPAEVEAIHQFLDGLQVARLLSAPIAWGARVTPMFRDRVRQMAANLKGRATASDYMACMAWESGETFSPAVKNMAGSGATGLIQFMPATAKGLGTSVEALARLTAIEQLEWVERYFRPWTGKLSSLADLYMAILWPAAVGKPLDHVLWDRSSRPTTYRQNAGLDSNRDARITKREAVAKVQAKLEKGLLPENRA
jgi:hypothetical protein